MVPGKQPYARIIISSQNMYFITSTVYRAACKAYTRRTAATDGKNDRDNDRARVQQLNSLGDLLIKAFSVTAEVLMFRHVTCLI